MSRPVLFGIVAMAAVVVASNILVQHLLGAWLTWGALTYPLAFLVTDLVNRFAGPVAARRVVVVGFAVGVVCSLVASQVGATTLRIALGSGIAFLVAQGLDVVIFDRLRQGRWWRAPVVSSLAGSAVDTLLFFSIAFAATFAFLDPGDPNGWAREAVPLLGLGPALPLWVSLAVADFGVKVALALLALLPFGLITRAGRRAA
ncbi:MAG: VUT family protein [Pseudomonadota bacterium]